MPWDEPKNIAKPIVAAIEKFNQSSSELSKQMIALSRRVYWLTWLIAILTIAMLICTAWLVFAKQ